MLALASRRVLTCADVNWNAAAGVLTWSAAVNLTGLVGSCELTAYANIVALQVSGRLQCADITWNYVNARIGRQQAIWLMAAGRCDVRGIDPSAQVSGVTSGAFCSPGGALGQTVTGLIMVCTTSDTDTRNRWRQA